MACGGFKTYVSLFNLPLHRVLVFWAGWSFFLTAVLMLNLLWLMHLGFQNARTWIPNLPAFSLSNGIAQSSLPQPYYANTNTFPTILDLEGNLPDPEKTFSSGLVIQKKQMRLWIEGWVDGKRPMVIPWTRWPDGEVNATYLYEIERLTWLQIPFYFFILWLLLAAMGMVQAYGFTMFVGFMERRMDIAFTFNQLFNISLFAITPASLLVATYLSVRFHEIHFGLLYFGVYSFVLIMAAGACRDSLRPRQSREDVEE